MAKTKGVYIVQQVGKVLFKGNLPSFPQYQYPTSLINPLGGACDGHIGSVAFLLIRLKICDGDFRLLLDVFLEQPELFFKHGDFVLGQFQSLVREPYHFVDGFIVTGHGSEWGELRSAFLHGHPGMLLGNVVGKVDDVSEDLRERMRFLMERWS